MWNKNSFLSFCFFVWGSLLSTNTKRVIGGHNTDPYSSVLVHRRSLRSMMPKEFFGVFAFFIVAWKVLFLFGKNYYRYLSQDGTSTIPGMIVRYTCTVQLYGTPRIAKESIWSMHTNERLICNDSLMMTSFILLIYCGVIFSNGSHSDHSCFCHFYQKRISFALWNTSLSRKRMNHHSLSIFFSQLAKDIKSSTTGSLRIILHYNRHYFHFNNSGANTHRRKTRNVIYTTRSRICSFVSNHWRAGNSNPQRTATKLEECLQWTSYCIETNRCHDNHQGP